jgi:hypothetical protein
LKNTQKCLSKYILKILGENNMNVRDNSKSKKKINMEKIIAMIFGGGTSDSHRYEETLKMFVIGPTVVLWSIIALVSIGVYYFNDGMVFGQTMMEGLLIASMIGMGMAVIGLIGKSDWNSEFGLGLFLRALGYNIALFLLVLTVDSGPGLKEYREPVKEFQFMVTDLDKCGYKITMKSEHLVYDYCSDYNAEYNELEKAKEINAMLVGKVKYGVNKADHVEFIKRNVVKK